MTNNASLSANTVRLGVWGGTCHVTMSGYALLTGRADSWIGIADNAATDLTMNDHSVIHVASNYLTMCDNVSTVSIHDFAQINCDGNIIIGDSWTGTSATGTVSTDGANAQMNAQSITIGLYGANGFRAPLPVPFTRRVTSSSETSGAVT